MYRWTAKIRQRRFVVVLAFAMVIMLSGCEEDKSEVSSGAGGSTGISSDGGAASLVYSGVTP
ncbi:MAG: hypothetical protein GKR96_00795 [Gammaproteobacteria bacterium]|nr:hypothetical protein [Gammaproteobacteria bacterium]